MAEMGHGPWSPESPFSTFLLIMLHMLTNQAAPLAPGCHRTSQHIEMQPEKPEDEKEELNVTSLMAFECCIFQSAPDTFIPNFPYIKKKKRKKGREKSNKQTRRHVYALPAGSNLASTISIYRAN